MHSPGSFANATYYVYEGEDGGTLARRRFEGGEVDEEDRLLIGSGMEKLAWMAVGDNWDTSCEGLKDMTEYMTVGHFILS